MISFLGILFDGLAYGVLLFLISVGLSVTLGLMGFINLAHGVFAMAGGYLLVTLTGQFGAGTRVVSTPLSRYGARTGIADGGHHLRRGCACHLAVWTGPAAIGTAAVSRRTTLHWRARSIALPAVPDRRG